MNNRLNKLTDSLESQLNYKSRRPGRQLPKNKYKGSPLMQPHSTPPMLLTSRVSRSPRISSYHHSVSFDSSSQSNQSKEILIVDEPEDCQILIVESESQLSSVRERGEEKQGEQQRGEEMGVSTPEKVEEVRQDAGEIREDVEREEQEWQPQITPKKQSPIYILEDDDNLFWIKKQEDEQQKQQEVQKPQEMSISHSIKIEEEQEQEWQQQRIKIQQFEERYINLPQIAQLSSIEQQDIQESFHTMNNSRIPVSPHTTTPLTKLQKIQDRIKQLQQQYQTTQNHINSVDSQFSAISHIANSPLISLSGHINNTDNHVNSTNSHKQLESILIHEDGHEEMHEEPPLSSKYTTSYSQSNLVDEESIIQMLDSKVNRPFGNSINKTIKLKEDLQPRTLKSVEEMEQLINKESKLFHHKISQQLGTIGIYRTAIQHRIRIPQKGQQKRGGFSEDQQILINQYLLRKMAGMRVKQQ